jgi:hypothetical protein
MFTVNAENAARARTILENKIAKGRESALQLFERIHSDAPRDSIARGGALAFAPVGAKVQMSLGKGDALNIHPHALGQLASRAGVPGAYLSESIAAGGWRSELAAEILNRHYHEGTESGQRFLVRSVRGEARGFLSDKYRRLDSRPLIDAFATECQAIGAVPVDGTITDTRVALKALIPTVYEPVANEVLAFGVEWHNSDFGAGLHAVRAFILRLWCLNGATMENALGQVHLGRQLSDDIELSQRTYELDTKTSISALRDVVGGLLAPKKIAALCEGIRSADEKKIAWKSVTDKLGRRLLKGEIEAARSAFESEDVVNLPAGKSVWRASNALSWIAGQTDDQDRKLELQRMAGEIVNGQRDAAVAA